MEVPIPNDPRHQRFADNWLLGMKTCDAYMKAGFECTNKASASASAGRLLRTKAVREYIKAMQKQTVTSTTLTLIEIREFCARVVRTPITKLDVDSDENGDLIKSYSKNESELASSLRLEKHDPFRAIEIDLKISGDDPHANALEALAKEIGKLGRMNPLPDGKL